jgi:cytoskeletal protein CcmA (bactofilin family)
MFSRVRRAAGARALVPAGAAFEEPAPTGPSILAADLTVRGDLASSGELHIDGMVEGDVRARVLVIGGSGTVLGDVGAEELTIHGALRGMARARKVHLMPSCKVIADIEHDLLCIDEGAAFEGQCRRIDMDAGEVAMPRDGRADGLDEEPLSLEDGREDEDHDYRA